MNDPIYCRACLRKNEPNITHCIYCGALLHDPNESHTTLQVAIEPFIYHPTAQCAEYESLLEDDSFALFVMEQKEPLIVHNAPRIILGRMLEGIGESGVNLPNEEAIEMGVSRRHAQIGYEAEQYFLVDLHSTNGTWLNRQKLTPNVKYPLHSGDVITLGRFRLLLCFNALNRRFLQSYLDRYSCLI